MWPTHLSGAGLFRRGLVWVRVGHNLRILLSSAVKLTGFSESYDQQFSDLIFKEYFFQNVFLKIVSSIRTFKSLRDYFVSAALTPSPLAWRALHFWQSEFAMDGSSVTTLLGIPAKCNVWLGEDRKTTSFFRFFWQIILKLFQFPFLQELNFIRKAFLGFSETYRVIFFTGTHLNC